MVKTIDCFTSDECGLTDRAFQHIRLSVRSTKALFSLCSSFIHLLSAACYMLQLLSTCTMLQKQVSVFSIFIITVYQSLKSNLCSFHMKTSLPSPVCLINTVLVHVLAGDQWWPFFVTFYLLVTDILCLVIQYFGSIN